MPKVSVITINFNQPTVTLDLIRSLENCSFTDFEIIVVDNGSTNKNPDILKEEFPDILLEKSKRNLGFAGGNNLGIKKAQGEYLLFINNDVEVERDFFEPLIQELDSDRSVGIVSPKIYFFDSKKIIQYAGASQINPITSRGTFIGNMKVDDGGYNKTITTHFAHGAGMMVRKSAIENAGLMPELYFLYYEEMDWCNRIKEKGFLIKCVPKSVIYHKVSMSVGKSNPMKTYFLTRNRVIYIRRNCKGVMMPLSLAFFYLVALPKNLIALFLKREFGLMSAYWRGSLWNVFHLNLKS